MKTRILKPTLLFITMAVLILIASCKKEGNGPLNDYTITCNYKEKDFEFPGYITGTSTYTYSAHSLQEAQKYANEMSYDSGEEYKHCGAQ